MHDHEENHQDLVAGAAKQLEEIFENSEQGVYLYFDDKHKVCNEKFAKMLGFSPQEWAKVEEPFPEAFVAQESQETLVSAYRDAMEKAVGSTNPITWKKKDGSTLPSTVILVPFAFDGHLLALHFIS